MNPHLVVRCVAAAIVGGALGVFCGTYLGWAWYLILPLMLIVGGCFGVL